MGESRRKGAEKQQAEVERETKESGRKEDMWQGWGRGGGQYRYTGTGSTLPCGVKRAGGRAAAPAPTARGRTRGARAAQASLSAYCSFFLDGR